MNKIDKFIFSALYGGVPPVFLFLLFWWSTIKIIPENYIFLFALSGILIGIAIDAFFLKKIMSSVFSSNISVPMLVFLFYSVCIYGFFMGMPVFNIVMGGFAGRYCALRAGQKQVTGDSLKKYGNYTAAFSSFILLLFCFSSAVLALFCMNTPSEIKNMLGVSFDVTWTVIWFIIIAGGLSLIAAEYYLTKIVFKLSVKK
jgi:hypothetical protein